MKVNLRLLGCPVGCEDGIEALGVGCNVGWEVGIRLGWEVG